MTLLVDHGGFDGSFGGYGKRKATDTAVACHTKYRTKRKP